MSRYGNSEINIKALKFLISKDRSKFILKESTREEYNQLKNWLSPYVKGFRFMPRFKLTNWDGRYDNFNSGNIDFGLWQECYKCCKEYGYPFKVINKEHFPRDNKITREDVEEFALEFFKDHKTDKGEDFTPYPHQIDAAYKMLKHRYGLIEVATAGGKSLIFSIMVFYILKRRPDAKILLIVPSISLVTQFYDDMLDYNIGYNKENKNPLDIKIQEIMSDKPRKVRNDEEPNVYVGTYQSLINWGTPELEPDFYNQFNVVCVDECLHPDTKITMSDGNKKEVKYINIGDKVISYNQKTKKQEITEVEYVYKNLSIYQQMYEVEMENGEIIKITGNHKVLLTNNEWKRVDCLLEKDDILDFYI